ncbi:MAG: lysophospholipid acyltransferase family protein [Caldilineaceae bacterium]
MSATINYAELDYTQWSPVQRWAQRFFKLCSKLLTRTQVEGLENFPRQGPVLMAVNHLHLFDSPIFFCVVPRRAIIFAADKFQKNWLFNWILVNVGNVIYVKRGETDRRTITDSLKVLRAGGVLAVAPEGTRSRTGSLNKGHTGAVYLASRAPAPIVPMVAYGQEKAYAHWLRLRRVPIHVRIGAPMALPDGKLTVEQLEAKTDELMVTLARLLPHEYRGVYAEAAAECDNKAL